MHIPDGYLSPATAVVAYGAALPFWYQASRRVKEALRGQSAPFIAMFAAFSFTVQMFNLPVPGGTTAHAVGGTLMAVALGPWAAVVGLSTASIIQALFFGDGGITAIGANCFNLAIALPATGYAVYRLVSGRSPSPRRQIVAAAVGGYAGINVAALLVALELGLQPLLWSEGGRALYNPYGWEVTVPAILLVHLTVGGFVEAALTGLAVAYLQRAHPALLTGEFARQRHGIGRGGWILAGGLALMVLLSPLGLLAPGVADFEWGVEELQGMVGYLPAGLAHWEGVGPVAPFQDYRLGGSDAEASFVRQASAYALSAAVGVALIFSLFLAVRITLARRTPSAQRR